MNDKSVDLCEGLLPTLHYLRLRMSQLVVVESFIDNHLVILLE